MEDNPKCPLPHPDNDVIMYIMENIIWGGKEGGLFRVFRRLRQFLAGGRRRC